MTVFVIELFEETCLEVGDLENDAFVVNYCPTDLMSLYSLYSKQRSLKNSSRDKSGNWATRRRRINQIWNSTSTLLRRATMAPRIILHGDTATLSSSSVGVPEGSTKGQRGGALSGEMADVARDRFWQCGTRQPGRRAGRSVGNNTSKYTTHAVRASTTTHTPRTRGQHTDEPEAPMGQLNTNARVTTIDVWRRRMRQAQRTSRPDRMCISANSWAMVPTPFAQ